MCPRDARGVEITFDTNKLREECSSFRLSVKRYGERQARKIRQRLDDLRAAATLEEMRYIGGRCHELTGDRRGQLSLDLVQPYRLIFEVANEPIPRKPDGGLDWKLVTAVRILGVEDTHE
ncbi:MAG: killer suppression protein [Anaerolineae bacterium]|nr:killer suppression protein [Anaerolineae bacterium]